MLKLFRLKVLEKNTIAALWQSTELSEDPQSIHLILRRINDLIKRIFKGTSTKALESLGRSGITWRDTGRDE
jgi:hypothetical protein